jgi:hypothetical protein
VVISPATITSPVVTSVSQATLLWGSSAMTASRMASEIWSAILSGCPSVTDSEVKRCEPLSFWSSAAFQAVVLAVFSAILLTFLVFPAAMRYALYHFHNIAIVAMLAIRRRARF